MKVFPFWAPVKFLYKYYNKLGILGQPAEITTSPSSSTSTRGVV